MSEKNMALPPDMWPGSSGIIIASIGAFLLGIMSNTGHTDDVPDGFVPDFDYADRGRQLVENYQYWSGLDCDGGIGEKTRAKMKENGYDIEAIALALPGVTIFVQADGTRIAWDRENGQVPIIDEGDGEESSLPPGDGEAYVSD